MRTIGKTLQIAFTYIGTVVGAGFATGQEILQFFTRYGWWAAATIAAASILFIWLGTKLMLMSHDIGAASYEDFNKHLFGEAWGRRISTVSMFLIFGVSSVMLAGAGSVFEEHLHISYQTGLAVTLVLAYLVLSNGMRGILAVNSLVVPVMLSFTCIVVAHTLQSPARSNWLELSGDFSLAQIWTSPLLYAAFNLSMAQAVLVPLGSSVTDRRPLLWGGILGGIGVGAMLLAGHFALSAQMPGITQFDIPMGHLISGLGMTVQLIYIVIIYAEIFTTFLADVYGIMIQISQRSSLHSQWILLLILGLCYLVSQAGFTFLLSTLYPLFGAISIAWLGMMIWRRRIA
ncbi:YkvI family membrane protein [Paenibacillus gansuensis]|uniref:Membrane protein YkvI n=1 Tax=Paenibacillus gansuensis TaxID=306542 RepID=A0ABW5PGT8_9BACL